MIQIGVKRLSPSDKTNINHDTTPWIGLYHKYRPGIGTVWQIIQTRDKSFWASTIIRYNEYSPHISFSSIIIEYHLQFFVKEVGV